MVSRLIKLDGSFQAVWLLRNISESTLSRSVALQDIQRGSKNVLTL
jgi:hypothetical protein